MRQKILIRTAAGFGFTAVAWGAFGAHALKATLSSHHLLDTWQTAAHYHLLHAVVLLVLATNTTHHQRSFFAIALGTLLFSGSLYLYALTTIKAFAWLTPLGGLCLLLGWAFLFFPSKNTD